MDIGLFEKYKETVLEDSGTLFGLDLLKAVKTCTCPYCFRKLKLMMNQPLYYCRNKEHKSFVISKEKIDKAKLYATM